MADGSLLLPTHEGLRAGSRLRALTADQLRSIDVLVLVGAGLAAAAATALLDFGWRIPGHAILRTLLPLAVGLACVPRRGSGFIMSGAAGVGLLVLRALGVAGGGAGAFTSLLLTGPLLDAASGWTRRGWQIYLSFAGAGLASNMAAFLVRWVTKAASGGGGGQGLGGGRMLGEWQSQAIVTYALCGLLAGWIGAAICFRGTSPGPREGSPAR